MLIFMWFERYNNNFGKQKKEKYKAKKYIGIGVTEGAFRFSHVALRWA